MRENVRVIIFLSMRRTQSNKHLHTLIYDINISLFLCFFVWKKYLIPQKYRLFVVNKKKKEMCACFTFFSYLHTKKVCHYSITMWTWLKKIKVSSIKYKCIFSVRNPTDYPIPQPPHPHSTHPQAKKVWILEIQ